MECKHTKTVKKSDDVLQSINDTDTFDYSMQNKITHKICEHNNYNNGYDELAYPFSKRIKLKNEPKKAQENVPVQYTADIIVEIKNRDGTVVPMRALLDTGTTATIILREIVGPHKTKLTVSFSLPSVKASQSITKHHKASQSITKHHRTALLTGGINVYKWFKYSQESQAFTKLSSQLRGASE
jgi:hypothetical protein